MKSHHVLSRYAVIVASALAATAADAGAQNTPPNRAPAEIRTSASADRSLDPDLAIVTVRFAAVGISPLIAGHFVAARADSLRKAFQALGVPRDSIITGSRHNSPAEPGSRVDVVIGPGERFPNGVYRIDTTYRVRETLAVRIRDLSKVGAVIDSAFAHGVIDIPPISFVATNTEDARLSATREATERVRAKASAMAAANGGRLGRTISLSTDGGGYYDDRDDIVAITSAAYSAGRTTGAGTIIVGPQIRITVTVTGRWELTDGQ